MKRDMLDDEKVASLSDRGFRLWITILLSADDHGRFRANPKHLAARGWWATGSIPSGEEAEKALSDLEKMGLLCIYSVNSEQFGEVKGWDKHQRIDNAASPECPPNPTIAATSGVTAIMPRTAALLPLGEGGGEGEGSSNRNPGKGSDKGAESAKAVFEAWLGEWTRYVGKGRQPILDAARSRKVRDRLRDGFTVEDLCAAARGIWRSKWHRDEKRTDLSLALRDADHVERFMREGAEKASSRPVNASLPPERTATPPVSQEPPEPPLTPEELEERKALFREFEKSLIGGRKRPAA